MDLWQKFLVTISRRKVTLLAFLSLTNFTVFSNDWLFEEQRRNDKNDLLTCVLMPQVLMEQFEAKDKWRCLQMPFEQFMFFTDF